MSKMVKIEMLKTGETQRGVRYDAPGSGLAAVFVGKGLFNPMPEVLRFYVECARRKLVYVNGVFAHEVTWNRDGVGFEEGTAPEDGVPQVLEFTWDTNDIPLLEERQLDEQGDEDQDGIDV